MQPDPAEMNRWSAAAPFWEKYREIIRQMFAPVTQALIADAMIGSRQVVLDIATGPGEPALSLAAVVGPEGKVFGIDPVPQMVAAARRGAVQFGISNAVFEVAHPDQLPFPDDTFDAVVCRFGAMFFPSPVDAVREILRVLKPGRKLALAVWHFAEKNRAFDAISHVIQGYLDSPPPAPDAPDAFRFASPGKLRDVLVAAGATGPTERILEFTIHAPVSPEDFWTMRGEMSEKLREKLNSLSGEQLNEVKRQSLETLRQYATNGGLSLPAQVVIVAGQAPTR